MEICAGMPSEYPVILKFNLLLKRNITYIFLRGLCTNEPLKFVKRTIEKQVHRTLPPCKKKKKKTKVGPCCNARPYRPKINPDRNVKKGHDDDGNGNELIHSGQEASLNNVVQLCCGIIKWSCPRIVVQQLYKKYTLQESHLLYDILHLYVIATFL